MVGNTVPVMRLSTLLVAGVLLVSACSDASIDPTTTTTPPPIASTTIAPTTTAPTAPTTTTTAPPSTTAEPPATTATTVDPLARPEVLISNVNRDSIDDFDTTGDDLYRIVVELLDLFTYLEGNPTGTAEEMVSLMFERDYPYWDPIIVGFLELEENPGWRYVDPGDQILAVELVAVDGDIAVARVVHQRGEQLVADSTGQIVRTYDANVLRVTAYTLARGSDKRWRFADVDPSSSVSDGEIAQMVPVEWQGRSL